MAYRPPDFMFIMVCEMTNEPIRLLSLRLLKHKNFKITSLRLPIDVVTSAHNINNSIAQGFVFNTLILRNHYTYQSQLHYWQNPSLPWLWVWIHFSWLLPRLRLKLFFFFNTHSLSPMTTTRAVDKNEDVAFLIQQLQLSMMEDRKR